MKELFTIAETIARQLSDKGFAQADVHLQFDSASKMSVVVWARGVDETAPGSYRHKIWLGPSIDEALAKFQTWIDAQPSPEERIRQTFVRKVADAVDFGTEHGFEIAGLQTYHTNLLEAPR